MIRKGVSERKGVGEGESGSLDNPHDGGFRRRYPNFLQIVADIAHLSEVFREQIADASQLRIDNSYYWQNYEGKIERLTYMIYQRSSRVILSSLQTV